MRMVIPLVQRHCINGINKEEARYIKEIPKLEEKLDKLENWTIVSNEDDIFDTIDDKKYFKHDTYLYFNGSSSGIHGYFIKGFPKKEVRIIFTNVDSLASDNLGFVKYDLSVTNDDRFQIRDYVLVFDFDAIPIKTEDSTELRYPEYGTSYDDYGDYGKILMFVRSSSTEE